MADVRALLKAKRQEARINHPYAAYGANGALRCTACGVAVKIASAWEGHLGSKSHRVAVANLKAKAEQSSARTTATAATTTLSKRKAEEEQGGDDDDDDDDRQMRVEVVRTEEVGQPQSRSGKRQRTEEREVEGQAQASRAFPADFFSDPSRAPPRDDGEEEDEMMDQDQDQETTTRTTAPPKSQFDMEWEAFERDLQQPRPVEGADSAGAEATVVDPHVVHARATIAAEPELVSSFVGLPAGTQGGDDDAGGAQGVEERKAVAISEEEGRKRREMDDRELIIDRLVEEERAQEDAYNRVALLRNKVQMLKQKRQLAKAKGDKADTQT